MCGQTLLFIVIANCAIESETEEGLEGYSKEARFGK